MLSLSPSSVISAWALEMALSSKNMQPASSSESMTSPSTVEDLDSLCLKAVADGDQKAFSSLVERWQVRLLNFFYKSTNNRADAEDLVQETFLDLYRASSRYNARGTFSSFLFTLARRRLIDSYRKKARRPLDYLDPQDFTMQSQAQPGDKQREIKSAFYRALQKLPEKHRMAILLLQEQGLSYEEIAQCMASSKSSVKTWIHRARQQLRTEMKDYYEKS